MALPGVVALPAYLVLNACGKLFANVNTLKTAFGGLVPKLAKPVVRLVAAKAAVTLVFTRTP